MATLLGRNAKVTIGEDTIAEMASWDAEISADAIIEPVFGNTWTKVHGLATTGWTATVAGLLDITDATGQTVLRDATISGTKVTTLRLYVDATNYYTSDTSSDAEAGCYITSHAPAVAQGDVARVSYSIQGTGPIHLTS
jgi:hypothetical protein